MNYKDTVLILGVDSSTKYALNYAKEIGVRTIITDYNTIDKCPLKKLADVSWDINVSEVDILEKKCLEEHVTAIYAGNHEFCIEQARILTKRLNLPFYASDQAWEHSKNKVSFKKACIDAGIEVPRNYDFTSISSSGNSSEIVNYPVMVKPADASSSKGLSICHNYDELVQAYNKALTFSQNVIIEDYIDGDEFDISLYCDNGVVYLLRIMKHYTQTINNNKKFVLVYGPYKQIYPEYFENIHPNVIQLLKNMNCTNGFLFIQAIRKNSKWYFLEMNYRISGLSIHSAEKYLYGQSSAEKSLALALNRPYNYDPTKTANSEGKMVGFFYYSKPGIIDKIEGVDIVKSLEGVEITVERFKEKDEVKQTNDMTQIAYYIVLWDKTDEGIINKLKTINNTLHFIDQNGNQMLIPLENYDFS